MASLTEARKALQQQLADKKTKLDELKAELSNKEEQRKTLQSELGTDLVSGLTAAQQDELQALGASITKLEKALKEQRHAREQLESQKLQLESELTNKLLKQRDQIVDVR